MLLVNYCLKDSGLRDKNQKRLCLIYWRFKIVGNINQNKIHTIKNVQNYINSNDIFQQILKTSMCLRIVVQNSTISFKYLRVIFSKWQQNNYLPLILYLHT